MKKTGNVTWQEQGDSLANCFHAAMNPEAPVKLAHALNLYRLDHKPGFGRHDNVSYQSQDMALGPEQSGVIDCMRFAAQSLYKTCGDKVDFIGVASTEDLNLVPDDFEKIQLLTGRQAFNGDSPEVLRAKDLPKLFDVLDSIKLSKSKATHLVFTNSDIHLQPWFYEVAVSFLRSGYDSMIVNRRTVEREPRQLHFAPLSLRQAESGITHPGLDCFIFPRAWLDQFQRTEAVIGRGSVMRSLLFNMVAVAENLLVLAHAQMTYHFGDDRPWMQPSAKAQEHLNMEEAAQLWLKLASSKQARHNLLALGKLFRKYLPALPKEQIEYYLELEN